MEGGNMDMAGSGGTTGNSRWNPTKEQISLLESLYMQGIRTPSADQIQQITSRLKVYGTIEGKNVFYWFQNHKARQRQKQKQENMAYINRYLHRTQPVYPPPPRAGPNGSFRNPFSFNYCCKWHLLFDSLLNFLLPLLLLGFVAGFCSIYYYFILDIASFRAVSTCRWARYVC